MNRKEKYWIKEDFFPKAVVFDMDGLMLDTERIIKYSWDVTGENLGYGKLGDDIKNTLGMNRDQRNAYFLGKYGDKFPLDAFLDGYHQVYYEYEKKNGIPKKEGLLSLLDCLKKEKIPMAVATSTHQKYAIDALKEQGIFSYFQEIITGDCVEFGKPNPAIYALACERLKVNPCFALALEDSYNGILSAARAGMKVIMIPDLLEDETPVQEYLYGKLKTLEYVKKWIEEKNFENKHN